MPLPCAGIIALYTRTCKCPHKISKMCETMKKTTTTPLPEKNPEQDRTSQVILFLMGNITPQVTPGAVHKPVKKEWKSA